MKRQKQNLDRAIAVLEEGGVIAYPTEAVYGLGCDPHNLSAVKKILDLKKRQKEKGLILVASRLDQFKNYIKPLEKHIEQKLIKSWEDKNTAVTWLVPVKDELSEYLKGQFNSLAIRVSHHVIVKELCEKYNGAIVSTSANISMQEAAQTTSEVQEIFGNNVDFIIDGEVNTNAQPSEIRDALTDEIIRH